MKIEIKNVGYIKKCDMNIDDISIVVGKNASGKSTIGKAIFSVLHSISDSQKIVYLDELDKFLNNNLDGILREIDSEFKEFSEVYKHN